LTEDQNSHPVEALAQQLDKVTGLVRTLGDLYSPKQDSFAAGNSFIAHGLVAVSTLLADAQVSLDVIHHSFDFRADSNIVGASEPLREDIPMDEAPMVFPPIEPAWGQDEVQSRVVENEDVLEATPQRVIASGDEFAQSYLELLRKLTAAEVFAAEQQALAPPGSGQNFLPLLRSLREEFQKLHKVA
jgi:hypothetical protein